MALARVNRRTLVVNMECPDCQQCLPVQVEVLIEARDKYSTCDREGCCGRPGTGPHGERRYVTAEAESQTYVIHHDCPQGREEARA